MILPIKKITTRGSRGSVLVTVLVLSSILFLMCLMLVSIVTQDSTRNSYFKRRITAYWLAEGEAVNYIARISSGLEVLKDETFTVNLEDGTVNISLNRDDDSDIKYILTSEADVDGIRALSKRGIEAFYLSDYTVSTRSNLIITAKDLSAVFSGKLFIMGDFALSVKDGVEVSFMDDKNTGPLINLTGSVSITGSQDKTRVDMFRAEYLPYSLKQPWTEDINPVMLFHGGTNFYKRGSFPDINEIKPESFNIKYPDFKHKFDVLVQLTDDRWRLIGKQGSWVKKIKILNPKIREKDLLFVADGEKNVYSYKPKNRVINTIYMRKVSPGQDLDTINIDPVADADSIGFKFFSARNGTMKFPAPNTRVKLQLPEDAFRTQGRIYYGTLNKSYCSVENPLTRFYINSLGRDQRYELDTHYRINYIGKYIEFTAPLFFQDFFYFLPEIGNGYRIGFNILDTIPVKYAYINDQIETSFKKYGSQIFFFNPPKKDARISIMMKEPVLYGVKGPPLAGIGIFVDKEIEALYINLSDMNYYPSKGVIVTDQPVYVTGVARSPITICSLNDIYINNINKDTDSGKPVGIIAGGVVWIHNTNSSTNENRRVFISSDAERVYTTAYSAPDKKGKKKKLIPSYIIGSVHLRCRTKNLYFNYPASLNDPDALIFSSEPYFSVQYRYDPYFANHKNLPPGVLPIVQVVWRKGG